jgi:formate--tetrahydrofolate ligase
VVVANRFPGDTEEELARVGRYCREKGIPWVTSNAFAEGADGARAVAEAVVALTAEGKQSRFAYPEGTPPGRALELLVTRFYGGASLQIDPEAEGQLATFRRWEETGGPICVAKTPLSLSDDPKVLGGPSGFIATARRFTRSAGAEFTVAYLGSVQTMPGLPPRPAAESIDMDSEGQVVGLR